MVDLLRRRGTDIFRTKGVLNLAGNDKRFVFQGVHMLFDGQDGRPRRENPAPTDGNTHGGGSIAAPDRSRGAGDSAMDVR